MRTRGANVAVVVLGLVLMSSFVSGQAVLSPRRSPLSGSVALCAGTSTIPSAEYEESAAAEDAANGNAWTSSGDWPRTNSSAWERVEWPEWNAGLSGANVLTSPESDLRLRVVGGAGVGGQINSAGSDFYYGIYRARLKAPPPTSSPYGTCGAFFFCRTDHEEIGFELLSSRYGFVYFVVQGGEAFRIPVDDPARRWHIYEFRWYPGEVRVYLDGSPAVGDRIRAGGTHGEDQVLESGVLVVARANIPSRPGKVILNHWSGNGWAGSPPAGDASMMVAWVDYCPVRPQQMLPLISSSARS